MSTPASLHSDLGGRIETAVADVLPYLNKAVWLVAKRLFYHKSKLVSSPLWLIASAEKETVDLPSDYAGLFGDPFLLAGEYLIADGEIFYDANGQLVFVAGGGGTFYPYTLERLPSQDSRVRYFNTASTPRFYELIGTELRLTPKPSVATTIGGDYFAKPATLTDTDSTLPWTGRFDDLLAEYLVEATKLRPIPEASLQQLIVGGVDDYMKRMDRTPPTRLKRFRLRFR